ncbi:MAG: CO dehydrogenase nickel-insertion accessory protein CooC [Thermoprotei archaeon]|nr:MAG: CO dehydrogenase nickel-insertion accessory protein CooC [Thermoprotei archaeon]
MKILVAGKGGVGKTTIVALLSHIFSNHEYKVLALDTDSVPNLAQSLGIPLDEAFKIVPLTKNMKLIEEKTGARPGEGWGVLFSLTPKVDDIVERYGVKVKDNLNLVVVGSIDVSKEGCLCPAIALAKAFLRHVFLKRKEIIIVDAEAGAEVFGRGLAEKFDLFLCITEPTIKSLIISKKLIKMAKELGIKKTILVINKVRDSLEAAKSYSRIFPEKNVPYHIVHYDNNLQEVEMKGLGVTNLPKNSIIVHDVLLLYNKISKFIK